MNTAVKTNFRFGYWPSLDGLRGIAILAVMAYNGHLSFAKGGFIGVDIFFVLSGFLITSLLIQEWERTGSISLKRFYIRRALRLLPALFLVILFCCVYAVLYQPGDKAETTLKGAVYTLFYMANWAQALNPPHGIGALSHAWSLSVEEQFYGLWPLLLIGLLWLNLRRSRMLLILTFFISASVMWRAVLWHSGAHYMRLYAGSDTRADALLIGCIAGLLLSWNMMPTTRTVSVLIKTVAFAAIPFLICLGIYGSIQGGYMYYGVFTLVAIGAVAILVEALGSSSKFIVGVLEFPALVWIGRISYSLYLWHFPVFGALPVEKLNRLHLHPLLFQPLRFGVTFAVACASFYLVEQSFLRLKKRFEVDRPMRTEPVLLKVCSQP